MKNWSTACSITLVACALVVGGWIGSSLADDKKKVDLSFKQPSPEEMQKMMRVYMETTKPSKYHSYLHQFLGEWESKSKIWMAGPNGPPTESKGTAKYSWAVEGKWLRIEATGTLMGIPMKGFGIQGYDNFKKKYVGLWIDSMGTALLTYEGTLDKTGKTLMQWGKMDEPMTGEHDKAVKYVTHSVQGDKFTFEIHDLAIGGNNTKVIEVEYTRKK